MNNEINEAKETVVVQAIGEEQISKARRTLEEYKAAKSNYDKKIVENEQWWKLRHWKDEEHKTGKFVPATAWLWNVIASKHADMENAYPEPNIIPREPNDREEANRLSSIIPVVLEQNEFHETYSECNWYKLKQGAVVYKVFFDGTKLNGLGDISIKMVDILNIFVESGIKDIQDSKNLFHTELVDNEILKQNYPQLTDAVLGREESGAKYLYDDTVDVSNKSTVIDWYYKKKVGNKTVLHYVKFVGSTILFATENETEAPTAPVIDVQTNQPMRDAVTGEVITKQIRPALAETGLYEHGLYPYVVDVLYGFEGTPWGMGYTDICKDNQVVIDQANAAMVKNILMAAKKRYFVSDQVEFNLEEFADWETEIVRCSGNMNDETIREISAGSLPSICQSVYESQIEMLKETSGNRDVSNGGTTAGVTSASGIAALQESSGKQSADVISTTYKAFKSIVNQVIELIRQFYDTPRQFRILGSKGTEEFVSYDNRSIRPQSQGGQEFGIDMGYRLPVFDIKVSASKASAYTRVAQNDLAIQFYQLGLFNPSNATQALSMMSIMDFDGKNEVIQIIEKNGTLLSLFTQLWQMSVQMAQICNPAIIPQLQAMALQVGIIDQTQMINPAGATMQSTNKSTKEHPFVERARANAQNAAMPQGV